MVSEKFPGQSGGAMVGKSRVVLEDHGRYGSRDVLAA